MEYSDFLNEAHFDQVQPLGAGGSTSLSYLVKKGDKQYFMKRLRPEYQSSRRHRSAFFKEYEVGRRVSSPWLVKYEGINEDDEGLYLLLEYINGQTLEERIQSDPWWFAKNGNLKRVFKQILLALRDLHNRNVLYLDLSATNVMLTNVSNEVRLIDLGFCVADSYTDTAGCTFKFAAPNAFDKVSGKFTVANDIYAAGKLIQYVADTAGINISWRLRRVIAKCTRENPAERYHSAEEALASLRTLWESFSRYLFMGGFAVVMLCALTWTINFFVTNDSYTFKARLKWFMSDIRYDTLMGNVLYSVFSETDRICEVSGVRVSTAYISTEVHIDGKKYRATRIGVGAFEGNSNLLSVYIPEGMEYVGTRAFASATNVISIELPNSVKGMGNEVFADMESLRYVKLSSGVKRLPNNTFTSCVNLRSVIIPEGVEEIGLDALAHCIKLEEVYLPCTLRKIDRGVFWKCSALKEIHLPASLEEIGIYSFFYCDNLKDVYNYSSVPQRVAPIFNHRDFVLHVPAGSEEAYRNAEIWKDVKSIVGDL